MERTDGLGAAVFDATPHEAAVVDAGGTIVAVNDAWRRFADENHGTHATYWVGEDYFAVCEAAGDDLAGPEVADGLRAVVAGDRDRYRHEYPCHSPEEQRWFRLDARRFHHDGDPYLLVVHTNVTAETFAALQADARAQQLETLVDVLTHDLRNPLNVIDGYVDLLAADLDDDRIETIRQAVTRIAEITEATVDFTKSGALADTEPLSTGALAREAWASTRSASATLVVEESREVIGDHRPLLQLFENLFRNVVERADTGCTVTLGALEAGFFVEDDGPGVPDAVRRKVAAADFSTQGTGGVELAIVQAVVNAHGADLTVTTADSGGARFEFTGFDVPPEPLV